MTNAEDVATSVTKILSGTVSPQPRLQSRLMFAGAMEKPTNAIRLTLTQTHVILMFVPPLTVVIQAAATAKASAGPSTAATEI